MEDTFKTSRSSSRKNFLTLLIPHLVSGNVRDEEMLTHSGYLGLDDEEASNLVVLELQKDDFDNEELVKCTALVTHNKKLKL